MILPPKFGLALFLLAAALPLLEIAVMIKVAGSIGIPLTLLAIFATAVLGVRVLQGHGFVVMRRMNETLKQGGTPLQPMIEGGLLFLAGWLLISPGFICDAIGLALLAPPVRHAAAAAIRSSLWPGLGTQDDDSATAEPRQGPFQRQPQGAARHDADGPIIEGEFQRIDERDMPSQGRPGQGQGGSGGPSQRRTDGDRGRG